LKFLIIQTAHIGDVILALPVAQALRSEHPNAEIHFVVRKGNESLLANHPAIDKTWVWDKSFKKYRNLFRLIAKLKKIKFNAAYNLQRFFSSGYIMFNIKAKEKIGFDKNPLAKFYTKSIPHIINQVKKDDFIHEVQRNLALLGKNELIRPKLYPSASDIAKVESLEIKQPFFIIAPASVWFTKQWTINKWQALANQLSKKGSVVAIGAKGDADLCDEVLNSIERSLNLCGELSLLQSAALMQQAKRVYCNDSAPMHLASSVNAPTTAIFCSTIPQFGFGPLSDDAEIVETNENLACRPCGLHGKKVCPEGHFKCATTIDLSQITI